ncbi:MAG TPA: GNAT family N-acetyltransferase [Opitutaceae bacterium]|jgi:ribosomal protein S18 acetylase RimI-like enzyme|nr:GNAT family N-acetyltransferase [Opitutaceae bacterium]
MKPQIEYRLLTPEDYDQALSLWRSCDGMRIGQGDDRVSYSRYILRNPGLSWAAFDGSLMVGTALCGHDGRRGLIYHLAVSAANRGQGIAKVMLKKGLDGLQECGIERAMILVLKDNAVGQEFWISQGFEPVDIAVTMGIDLKQ